MHWGTNSFSGLWEVSYMNYTRCLEQTFPQISFESDFHILQKKHPWMGLKPLLIPIPHVPLGWRSQPAEHTHPLNHISLHSNETRAGDQMLDDPSKTWRFWQICKYHHKRKMNFMEVCALLPQNRFVTHTTKGESKAFTQWNISSTISVCWRGPTPPWHPKGSTASESIFIKTNLKFVFKFNKFKFNLIFISFHFNLIPIFQFWEVGKQFRTNTLKILYICLWKLPKVACTSTNFSYC